jgi:hypothetical protein
MNPDENVPFNELIEEYSHLAATSRYRRLFEAATAATSATDTGRNQSIKYLRQAGLYQCAQQILCKGVRGDFAECGCFRGQATYMLASMLREAQVTTPIHVFDSFQGLSAFSPEDRDGGQHDAAHEARMREHFSWPEVAFRRSLSQFGGQICIHSGWIPDRFSDVAETRFALVHVDVDLYEPTRDSLAFFFPRLSPGGWIFVDDYNSSAFPGATRAVDEFLSALPSARFIPGQAGGCLIGV